MGEERSSVVMSGGCVKAVLRAEHTTTDSSDNDITDGRQVIQRHQVKCHVDGVTVTEVGITLTR